MNFLVARESIFKHTRFALGSGSHLPTRQRTCIRRHDDVDARAPDEDEQEYVLTIELRLPFISQAELCATLGHLRALKIKRGTPRSLSFLSSARHLTTLELPTECSNFLSRAALRESRGRTSRVELRSRRISARKPVPRPSFRSLVQSSTSTNSPGTRAPTVNFDTLAQIRCKLST